MTPKELIEILSQGESETVEFKQGKLLISTVAKLLTSFLNTKGGNLIVGINGAGKVLGLDDEIIERLQNFTLRIALKNIKPKASATFTPLLVFRKGFCAGAAPTTHCCSTLAFLKQTLFLKPCKSRCMPVGRTVLLVFRQVLSQWNR